MPRQLRQGLGVHLRLGRLDRGLLTAVPASIGLLFFFMLAMISYYQRDGAAIWLERMILALSLVAILLVFAFAHILKSWRRSDTFLYTDPLCPCGSRTAMQELLRRLEARRDIDITILYADLNHFKYVNDTFGHEAGDRLLITFSHILSRVFDGQHAMTARVGGDEFVVIFQDVTQREIADAWEQVELDLLEESRRLPFRYWITSAHGCATRPSGSIEPLDDVVRSADHAMYLCKERQKQAEALRNSA
ncbi:MAG: GGDEF domain-containing protein [Selenomonas sp.]|uniref:GGDEF domain-containing protein n=1 Tax=Selenomonas sp. TaxID=2053611 RepID=UPI0025F3E485|nr:GGDEF domain-containing protein [Selenomonas sp.]MCI6101156.1 GGDEF domain-containing protein [Selenomonas sp.]MCI6233102.1 GGDEF domain-containing protein [Selenomonas sp.]